uniref:DAGKc domain-containing protein n=1 Tax=Globodera pallida TaxID=36090 RepID=A0A183BWA6_GLOPA
MVNTKKGDDQTRRYYANRARQYGLATIEPIQRLRRVTVLINREAGGRRAADRFKRNALPLLNLAGLEVNIVEVSSAAEMESLCRVLDTGEADCVYLVGGDGTLSRALTGLCQNDAPLPVGLFPGGLNNKAFRRIFRSANQNEGSTNAKGENSVRLFCESAMALIEGENRRVFPVKCTITKETENESSEHQTADTNTPVTFWLLSDLSAGWFEHCEQRAPKLWWWGPLRHRFVYFWEFLKRRPTPLELQIVYEEFCPGCNRCMVPTKRNNSATFWSLLARLLWPSYADDTKSKTSADFTMVENPKCGQTHEASVSGADVRVNVAQTKNGNKLRLRVGGREGLGRWGAMRFGWNSAVGSSETDQQQQEVNTDDDKFYGLDIEADRLGLRFTHIPEFIQKLSLAGDWGDFEQYSSKQITLETTKVMSNGKSAPPLHFYMSKLQAEPALPLPPTQ